MIFIEKQRRSGLHLLALLDQHFRDDAPEIIGYQRIFALQRKFVQLAQGFAHQRNIEAFFQFDDFRHVTGFILRLQTAAKSGTAQRRYSPSLARTDWGMEFLLTRIAVVLYNT